MSTQTLLFPEIECYARNSSSSTFVDNMKLPVHRWFRFSAGFSAEWAEYVILKFKQKDSFTILDPFAGSGTTLLSADKLEVNSYGIEAHPFIHKVAQAKLLYRSDPENYLSLVLKIVKKAKSIKNKPDDYPDLIYKCFNPETLNELDKLRKAWLNFDNNSPESKLAWLTLIAILRNVSHVGTAPWQYVLPKRSKKVKMSPFLAFESMSKTISNDMRGFNTTSKVKTTLLQGDARTCLNVPSNSIDLVVTSPPYANNYDYADATRLELCFMRDIKGWCDLQDLVRKHLVHSCTQHVSSEKLNLDQIFYDPILQPIKNEISNVCNKLAHERLTKGGKKAYHLMVASYFLDMAKVWKALRRVCKKNSTVCFVIGDSAPYGVYIPVIEWMGSLATAVGFESYSFEKTRDRNTKWKNRKHTVPLCEGRLWVKG